MYKKSKLDNGLTVITNHLDGTQSATVLLLVGAGSRYETKEISGLSHFLEHMFFKGGKRFKNTNEVSKVIDRIGGMFNAFTGKEYVGYYVKSASKHIDVSFDVLSDMMLNAKLEDKEIDKERGVILEEYNMYQDTPMYQIGWNFERLLYGDQPMGWDQVGTKENINRFKHQDFVEYKKKLYTPDNIVISVAGNVDHNDILEKVNKFFTFGNDVKAYDAEKIKENTDKNRLYLKSKNTEQAHIMIGFPGYYENHPDYIASKLLATILGGNMSSRMFLSVREKQGLAYYISTSTDAYTDCGFIATNAGVALDRIDDAISSINEQYRIVKEEFVSEDELIKTKEFIKGRSILKLEDSEEYAHFLAKYAVLYGTVKTPEEIFAEIDKVTVKDLHRVANDLFKSDKLYLAVIGNYDDKAKFEKLMTL